MIYEFGHFRLDDRTCLLQAPDGIVPMEPRVFDLLAFLVRNRGRLVSKAELYQAIWSSRVVSEASLSVAMTAVRRAVGDDTVSQRFVATHHGRGYRFVHPVTELTGTGVAPPTPPSAQNHFVGRGEELDIMRGMFAASRSGHLQVLLVRGEPGIGKSRLLRRFSDEMETAGVAVLTGRSPEEQGAPGFWPWIQILRSHFAGSSPASTGALLAGVEDVVNLIPELRARIATRLPPALGDPVQARFRMFDAISTCIDRAATRQPTIVVLDDIHRADEASLLLFAYLAKTIAQSPLLIIASHRETARPPVFAKTLATLSRDSLARTIHLRGLGTTDSARLLEALTETSHSASLLSELQERTHGNPLFLVSIARHFVDSGKIDPSQLPGDLLSAIALQIEDLSAQTKEVLTAAAVAGTEFGLPLVAAVLDMTPAAVAIGLEEAIQSELITAGESATHFRFRHGLLRDALYHGMGTARRSVLHRATARSLVASHGSSPGRHLAVVAHHFAEAAATGCWEESVDFAIRAGDYSSSCLAYEESAEHYARALDFLDLANGTSDDARATLMVRLGAQLTKSGDRTRARNVLGEVLRQRGAGAPSGVIAEAALSLAPGVLALESGVVDSFLIELLDNAINRADPEDRATRARLLARQSLALHWSEDASLARSLAIESRMIANATEDPEAVASAMQAEWSSLHGPAHAEERRKLAAELLSRQCHGASPETTLVSRLFGLYSALECGASEIVEAQLIGFQRIAESLRQPQGLWFTMMLDGMRAQLLGEFDRAAQLQGEFARLGAKASDVNAVHSALAHVTYQAYVRGDLGALLPAAQELAERFPTVDVWKAAVAWIFARNGQVDDARRWLLRLGGCRLATRQPRMDLNGTLCLAGEAAALVSDTELALVLYEKLLPLADRHVVLGLGTLCWGAAARVLGLLAESLSRHDEAVSHLENAIALNQAISAHAWVAQSQFDLGRVLAVAAPESRDRSSELMREALATAKRLGMTNLERDVCSAELTA